MAFHPIDGYLLDGRPSKSVAIQAVLAQPVADPRAQPFYRALEAIGVRAADEALIALRLVLGGKAPEDAAIRRLRALAALARADSARTVGAVFAKDGPALGDVAGLKSDPAAVSAAARRAYLAETQAG